MEELELIKNLALSSGAAGTAIVALLKNPDILKLLYQDLAQPSVKKVGDALGSVFGLAGTLMLPIKMINEKTNLLFTKRMEQYKEKINSIPDERIAEVPPEIGIPILDKLTYVQDEDIAGLYINLLAKASDKTDASKVHPYFVSAVNNLTPDEAVFIKNIYVNNIIKNNIIIPYSSLIEKQANPSGYRVKIEYLINNNYLSNLVFPNNYALYIDNLISLGFINKPEIEFIVDEGFYNDIKLQHQSLIDDWEIAIKQTGNSIELKKHKVDITETGRTFIKLVNQ
ncbi:hypothetical protein FACS1894110_12520 [Spirochaetia bacterium]|nr:hypothetical protein FACS1894110_12520 [Spirochaetia bacterium]